jgi:hypothetical protein
MKNCQYGPLCPTLPYGYLTCLNEPTTGYLTQKIYLYGEKVD